jgi:hypothetical protein
MIYFLPDGVSRASGVAKIVQDYGLALIFKRMLAGVGIVFGQTPEVLNLSHDLVANGIAASDMTPG